MRSKDFLVCRLWTTVRFPLAPLEHSWNHNLYFQKFDSPSEVTFSFRTAIYPIFLWDCALAFSLKLLISVKSNKIPPGPNLSTPNVNIIKQSDSHQEDLLDWNVQHLSQGLSGLHHDLVAVLRETNLWIHIEQTSSLPTVFLRFLVFLLIMIISNRYCSVVYIIIWTSNTVSVNESGCPPSNKSSSFSMDTFAKVTDGRGK